MKEDDSLFSLWGSASTRFRMSILRWCMKKLTQQEKAVWYKYNKVAGGGLNRCKINSLNIDCQPRERNHRPHELAKFNLFYDHTEQGHLVITECWEGKDVRRDIVCLSCNQVIEIENFSSKRGHRHPKSIEVFWYDLNRYRNKEEMIEDDAKLNNS